MIANEVKRYSRVYSFYLFVLYCQVRLRLQRKVSELEYTTCLLTMSGSLMKGYFMTAIAKVKMETRPSITTMQIEEREGQSFWK